MKKPPDPKPFHSAEEEVEKLVPKYETPQTLSPAYKLAFNDPDFLLREDLRPIRLQLELLKPELIQQDLGIESTIVIIGSSRIKEQKLAQEELDAAKLALEIDPDDEQTKMRVRCAKHILNKSKYFDESRKLAALISRHSQKDGNHHYTIVTGGGPGVMEAANRGAHDVQAKSIGLTITLPSEQAPNPYITPELCFKFHYFAIRKMHFLIRARALVAFPGGFGTLDELFEALTLVQTKKTDPIPIILFGKDYWSKLINFDMLVEEGAISPEDLLLFQYVETAKEAWKLIKDFYKGMND